MKKSFWKIGMVMMAVGMAGAPESRGLAAEKGVRMEATGETKDEMQEEKNGIVKRAFGNRYLVTASVLNVRSGPGAGYSKIGQLVEGDIIIVQSISSGWAKFTYKSQTAYVDANYLEYIFF